MVHYFRIEDVLRASSLDSIRDLFDALGIQTHGGFYRDAGVMVGTYNSWVTLVYLAATVNGIIHNIIMEFLFFYRPVDTIIVHKVATRWVYQGCVRFHPAE